MFERLKIRLWLLEENGFERLKIRPRPPGMKMFERLKIRPRPFGMKMFERLKIRVQPFGMKMFERLKIRVQPFGMKMFERLKIRVQPFGMKVIECVKEALALPFEMRIFERLLGLYLRSAQGRSGRFGGPIPAAWGPAILRPRGWKPRLPSPSLCRWRNEGRGRLLIVGLSLGIVGMVLAGEGSSSSTFRTPPPGGVGWKAPKPEDMRAALARARGKPFEARLEIVTEPLVGAPYMESPLGEGLGSVGPDEDPRMRFDAFDCTTFVETAMALAYSRTLEQALEHLDRIRYKGSSPNFLMRRHFPVAEWIPDLVHLGYLEPITRQVAGAEANVESKRLNLEVWKRRKHKELELPDNRIPDGVFNIETWPIDAAVAGYAKIPPGTVLNLVRVDYANMPTRVSHQGLVIRMHGQLFLRHAAQRLYHIVVDEPLDRFLLRMRKYQRWPVTGIHLEKVLEPAKG